jgi:hypothetical protein
VDPDLVASRRASSSSDRRIDLEARLAHAATWNRFRESPGVAGE